MSEFQGFGPTLVTFPEQLREHNERSWFDAHRERYEDTDREPARAFIRTMAPALAAIAPSRLRWMSRQVDVSAGRTRCSMNRDYDRGMMGQSTVG